MTVNPIGISNSNQSYDPTSFLTHMQQALAPVAQLFGESSDQLMSELQSGNTSLSALASSKGISQTDLVNAIKSGLQQAAPNNGTALSNTQLTNLANRIANRKHGHHRHREHKAHQELVKSHRRPLYAFWPRALLVSGCPAAPFSSAESTESCRAFFDDRELSTGRITHERWLPYSA